jgi:hypothetical protein
VFSLVKSKSIEVSWKALDNLVTASPSYTFQSLNCRDEIQLPGGAKLITGIEKVCCTIYST